MLQQHLLDLVAFQKSTYSGDMPISGTIARHVRSIIEELEGLGAIEPRKGRAA